MAKYCSINITPQYEHVYIKDLWPHVKSIVISVEEHNYYIYNEQKYETPPGRTYSPHSLCMFKFHCINSQCTCKHFDLYDVVSGMVLYRKPLRSGHKNCEGNVIGYNYKCCSVLNYEIKIEYHENQKD